MQTKKKQKKIILLYFDTFITIIFFKLKKGSKRVYIKNDSSGKQTDPGHFSKVSIYNFSGLKNVKKKGT